MSLSYPDIEKNQECQQEKICSNCYTAFPPGGPDADRQADPGFIPDSVVIASFDPEGLVSGWKVGECHKIPGTDLYPVIIDPFQHISIGIF